MLFAYQPSAASGQFNDAAFASGLRSLGPGSPAGPPAGRNDIVRVMHQAFRLDRFQPITDTDPVTLAATVFRKHWDTDYDLEIPMPFERPPLTDATVVLQAINRAATR